MNLKNNNQNIFIIVFFIILSFIFWFLIWWKWYFQQNIDSYKNNNQTNVLQDFNNLFTSDNKSSFSLEDLKIFNEALYLISKNYYSYDSITKKELVDWMIKWVVESLKDKHSEFFNIDETKKFNEVLSWDFEWIWAVVEKNDFWVSVDRLIAW